MTNPNHSGMPQSLRDWLDSINQRKRAAAASGLKYTPTNVREALETLTRRFVTEVPEVPLIRDELIAGPDYQVPVRIYHPEPGAVLPVVVFVHGGGHVAGNVSLYDPIARKTALAVRRILVSVDYRLAPECPYPAALKDSLAVVKGLYRTLELLCIPFQPRLALIGDSAGGALCATLAHRCQFEPGVSIESQALIYPSLDYTLSQPSVSGNGEGYLLERDRILWLFERYLQAAEDRRAVSPLFMPITAGYPRTLVSTAEHCPLRDEGIAYAQRLSEAGILCEQETVRGMIHAFLNLEDLVPRECSALYARLRGFFGQ
jgi:acetyl esterase/lipase